MIILDTNVVSEPLKPKPDLTVVAWLDDQPLETMFFTATGLAELLTGVEILPAGRRRKQLAAAIQSTVERLFGPRVLSFDQKAAGIFALTFARARSSGFTITPGDCQIAAIAVANGYPVATRDTEPFLAAGVDVINPWLG